MVRREGNSDIREGRYTRDHILFEGSDFEEWKAYIEGQLAKQKLLNQARAKKASVFQTPQGKKSRSYILEHVNQRIRGRLDINQNTSIPQLFSELEFECKSFDLFSLPAELRNEIYSLAFQTQREQDIYVPHTNTRGPAVPELPALLRIRGQMRDEASSIYFAESSFVLYLGCEHFQDNDERHEVAQHVEKWLDTRVKESDRKRLCRLKIEIEHAMGPGTDEDTRSVIFTASEDGQLSFEFPDDVGQHLPGRFANAAREINEESNRRNWRGEVIGRFVTEKKGLLHIAVISIRNMRSRTSN